MTDAAPQTIITPANPPDAITPAPAAPLAVDYPPGYTALNSGAPAGSPVTPTAPTPTPSSPPVAS